MMKFNYSLEEAQTQEDLPQPPYDRWIAESGEVMAEFYREKSGLRVRFSGKADFCVGTKPLSVTCNPVPAAARSALATLWHNSMLPLLDNYSGGVSLHGSACVIDRKAVGFIGASRRGKTTLAAACARAGHAFMAEDAIRLSAAGTGYEVLPARPLLRLFEDSAAHLAGSTDECSPADGKVDITASQTFNHHDQPARLQAIYLLGNGAATSTAFTPLGQQDALAELMRHAFILDIEDKPRLTAHFDRLAQLARHVPCIRMDFPRQFSELSNVVKRLAADVRSR